MPKNAVDLGFDGKKLQKTIDKAHGVVYNKFVTARRCEYGIRTHSALS